jgi:hypothetical protein
MGVFLTKKHLSDAGPVSIRRWRQRLVCSPLRHAQASVHRMRLYWSDRCRASASVANGVSSSAGLDDDRRGACLLLSRRTRQVAKNQRLDLTGPCLVSVGRADLWASDASNEGEDDRWKFDYARHVAASWASDAVSSDPTFWNNGSIWRGTSINTCWSALGSLSWYFDILVSILLSQHPHTSPHSSPCIRLRFLSEIEWFKCIVHCFASRGTWGIILLRDFLLLLVVAAT